jgi:hypothetical protein
LVVGIVQSRARFVILVRSIQSRAQCSGGDMFA